MKTFPLLENVGEKIFLFPVKESFFYTLVRIFLAASIGTFLLFKPALGLRLCSFLFPPGVLCGTWIFYKKSPSPARRLLWLLPAGALAVLFIPCHKDMAGILFVIITLASTSLRSFRKKTIIDRCVSFTAAALAVLFFCRMFQAEWFDLYTAAAPALWGTALWESTLLKCRHQ